jgi:hypothetical protein
VVREGLEKEKVKTAAAKAPAMEILQKTLGAKGFALGRLGTNNLFLVVRSSGMMPAIPGAHMSDPALDKLVSVKMSDTPVAVYLKSVTRQAGIKLSAGDELAKGRITVSLQKATAREALYALSAIKGWTFSRNRRSGVYEFSQAQ